MDQNIAVETVLLAYMVNHPGLYQQLAHYPAEIFYDEDHRTWFDAIRDCYSEAGECDSVALRTRMINEGHESAFTGKFQQIIMSPSIPTSLNTHVEALLDSYNLRRIKGFASDVMQCRTAEQAQKIMALAVNDALIDGGLTPIKRWGQPEDVANAVSVVCSGMLRFSTGEAINVDGGFHIRRL